jgi:hypothetical protein
LKSQLSLLKSTSQIVVNQRPLGATIPPGSEGIPIIEIGAQLTDSESEALRKALAKDFLTDQGRSIGQDGEVLTTTGRTLFEPGFVAAIRKVLGN